MTKTLQQTLNVTISHEEGSGMVKVELHLDGDQLMDDPGQITEKLQDMLEEGKTTGIYYDLIEGGEGAVLKVGKRKFAKLVPHEDTPQV